MSDHPVKPKPEVPATMRSLIETHSQPFVLIDREFNIVAVNQAYSTRYQLPADQLLGRKCHQVSHHADQPCFHHGEDCPHARLFRSQRQEQAIHIHYTPEGGQEYVDITAYPVFDDDGRLILMGELLKRIDVPGEGGLGNLVGASPAFLRSLAEAGGLAEGEAPVLIHGEPGVGKSAFATFLHSRSPRRQAALVTVICSGRCESELEAELFGSQPGALTGAEACPGALAQASGGSLYLREIGSLPPSLQTKLNQWLITGQYRRIGALRSELSDARLLASSTGDLQAMVRHGEFRGDLYYRLAGGHLNLPPLRERPQDITLLALHFLRQLPRPLSPAAEVLQRLQAYPFPGNAAELAQILEHAAANVGAGLSVEVEHLPPAVRDPQRTPPPTANHGGRPQAAACYRPRRSEDRTILGMDTETVLRTLAEQGGSRRQAAARLGISERKLYRLLDRYKLLGLDIPDPYQ